MAWKSKLPLLACASIIILALFTAYDLNGSSLDFSDRELVLIVTDSMDGDVAEYEVDSFPADTLAMIKYVPEHEVRFIRVGQIVSYYDGNILNNHRVVELDASGGCLIVQGDNSTTKERISFNCVVGVVVGTNHWLGEITSFLKSNLTILGYVFASIIVGALAVYVYRHMPERKSAKIGRTVMFGIALIAVLGVAAVGVGYSYTASTENTGNTVSSTYVVVSQSNYTFQSNGTFEYYSVTNAQTTLNNKVVPYYLIMDAEGNELSKYVVRFWNVDYYGIKVGDTVLSVDLSHYASLDDVVLSLSMPAEPKSANDDGFTKYSGSHGVDWRYFLKVYYKDEHGVEQDTQWFWSKGNGWNDFRTNSSSNVTLHEPGKDYTVELYYAAPGKVINGETLVSQEPLGYSKWNDGRTIIKNGWIKFLFDSSLNPVPEPEP